MAEFRDGLSNSVMVTEYLTGTKDDPRGSFRSTRAGLMFIQAAYTPNTPQADILHSSFCVTGANLPDQNLPCTTSSSDSAHLASARSVHPGGVNALLGDGSVYDPKLPLDFSALAEDGQSVKLAHSTRTIIAVKGQDALLPNDGSGFGLLLPAVAFNEELTIVHVGMQESSKPTPDGTTFLGGFELGAFAGDGSVRTAFTADWTATIDLVGLSGTVYALAAGAVLAAMITATLPETLNRH